MLLFKCVMSPGREKPTGRENCSQNQLRNVKFYRGQKGYLLKDHGLARGIETRYFPTTNAAPVHLRGDTLKPSKIPIFKRLYAVFDEVGRNNLTTLPTTKLGQNGAIIKQKQGS